MHMDIDKEIERYNKSKRKKALLAGIFFFLVTCICLYAIIFDDGVIFLPFAIVSFVISIGCFRSLYSRDIGHMPHKTERVTWHEDGAESHINKYGNYDGM